MGVEVLKTTKIARNMTKIDKKDNILIKFWPSVYDTGCHLETVEKFLLNTRALNHLMSWEKCHFIIEAGTFIYYVSKNLNIKFRKCQRAK